jgi:hypothetical protein
MFDGTFEIWGNGKELVSHAVARLKNSMTHKDQNRTLSEKYITPPRYTLHDF